MVDKTEWPFLLFTCQLPIFFPKIINFYSPFLHKLEPYPGGEGGQPPSGAYTIQPYTDDRYIGIQLN